MGSNPGAESLGGPVSDCPFRHPAFKSTIGHFSYAIDMLKLDQNRESIKPGILDTWDGYKSGVQTAG